MYACMPLYIYTKSGGNFLDINKHFPGFCTTFLKLCTYFMMEWQSHGKTSIFFKQDHNCLISFSGSMSGICRSRHPLATLWLHWRVRTSTLPWVEILQHLWSTLAYRTFSCNFTFLHSLTTKVIRLVLLERLDRKVLHCLTLELVPSLSTPYWSLTVLDWVLWVGVKHIVYSVALNSFTEYHGQNDSSSISKGAWSPLPVWTKFIPSTTEAELLSHCSATAIFSSKLCLSSFVCLPQ